MITDNDLIVSNEQAAGASAVSEKSIDLTVARDIGPGTMIQPFVRVTTACTGGTNNTMTVSVITSASEALTSETVLYSTAAIAAASLVAGYTFKLPPIPAGVAQRYLGLKYTNADTFTAGKLTAGFVLAEGKPVNDGVKF